MRTIFQIAKSELKLLFCSPIAWFVLVIYTFQLSYGFTEMLNGKLVNAVMGQRLDNLTFEVFISGFGSPLFKSVVSSLFLYIPLITMGLMSREYSSGSIKLLLSSPITEVQIILGKYFSMLAYGVIMMLIIGVYIIFGAFAIKDIDLPLLIAGVAAIYLLYCFYSAIGLFFSCITSYQIVAALGTIITMVFFQFIGKLFQATPFLGELTFWLSSTTHGLIRGLISSDHVLYFVLLSSMFVAFSILNIKFQRQKKTVFNKTLQYFSIFLLTLVIGYATSRPKTTLYWDVTRYKQETLTPKSQKILSQFKGEPVLTSYINFMGYPPVVNKGYPENINGDKLAFGQYIRFKPDMKMRYVYYYENVQTCNSSECEINNPDEFIALAKKTAGINSINFNKALTGDDIRQYIDDKEAENGFVRTFEVDNLPKGYIRMYINDLQPYPSEIEISTALAAMQDGVEKIGFTAGHGERDLDGTADQDYSGFPNSRSSRRTLINKGFYPLKLKVEEPIPTDVNIIVIADMRVPFSDDELKNIEQYIERGGNLVINTDINREKQMEPLIKLLGVGTIPGILAQGNSGYPPTSVFSYFSDSNKMVSSYLPSFKDRRIPIVMKGCVGLIKKSDKGFEVESLMEARRGTWNVTATSNPDEIEEDSLAANTTEIYSTALSLTRDIGGREQRVLIFGDSDWFSKGELSAGWTIAVANEYLISTMFKWMSYDKYPISFDRPSLPDNELHFKYKHKELSNLFFLFLFPLFWLGCGSVVWYRRKIK